MKVFSREKFIKDCQESQVDKNITESSLSVWANKIDGKEVINKHIDKFYISDDWCIEREDKPND